VVAPAVTGRAREQIIAREPRRAASAAVPIGTNLARLDRYSAVATPVVPTAYGSATDTTGTEAGGAVFKAAPA